VEPTLNFGYLYYPHVDSIRDYFPHWIAPRWTKESATLDLMIMRALGGRLVRYHILPIHYQMDHYPGCTAEVYRDLIPFSLKKAHELGMKTHVDLHTDDFQSLDVEDVLQRITEFGAETIDTLQLINEYFYLWNHKENLVKLESTLVRIRESGFQGRLCLDAGGSIHRSIKQSHPTLASFVEEMLPMASLHR